jgi:hypothetical protein
VPAVATASTIGVASLYVLSGMRARCVPSESKSIAQQAGLPYRAPGDHGLCVEMTLLCCPGPGRG